MALLTLSTKVDQFELKINLRTLQQPLLAFSGLLNDNYNKNFNLAFLPNKKRVQRPWKHLILAAGLEPFHVFFFSR